LDDGDKMRDIWEGFKELVIVTAGGVGILLWACLVIAILGGIGYGAYCLFETTLTPEQREEQRLADIAERTPHVYSKVDGCTVYIWKNGSYNSYFTKCDSNNKIVTEFSHSESCGKACTKKVTEKVETN
jgi:hypothetical protein